MTDPMRTPQGNLMSSVDIVAMQHEVKEWVTAKGWNKDRRTFGDELILIVSELVEALEAYREAGFEEWETYQLVINGVKMPKMTLEQCLVIFGEEFTIPPPRREGVAPELAGTLVRLLDTCARHNIDLGKEFRQEMDYNWGREYRHGGKKL